LLLDLIDLGIDDYEEVGNELILYTPFDKTGELRDKISGKNYNVISAQPIKKAKTYVEIVDVEKAKKIFSFIDKLEEHDDVQNVYTNIDVGDEIINQL
jgi:transcriptional/translational regulatory protein YebC/TACO1